MWDQIMARRAEGQFVRDWQLGFVSWNCRFKTAVNLSRTFWSYDTIKHDGQNVKVTAEQLESASIAIVHALRGQYVNAGTGRKMPVNGDLTKLKYVASLSPVAKRILSNAEATTRMMSGTQETRRQMRFDTTALRVKYGVPIFVTFSPDEKHNLLMIRLSRTRRKDPVLLKDAAAALFGGLKEPTLGNASCSLQSGDDVFLALSPEDLQNEVPDYDTRRALVAKDSLASVEGFRVMVLLAYQHLFGMRVCPNCPHCNHGEGAVPCQDLFGSNAKAEGGIFGRIDAGYSSFEAQKSTGALHAHSQLFVQCLHQHEPLAEVLQRLAEKPELVERYLKYKEHVCRQMFGDDSLVASWEKGRRKEVESNWPEYRETSTLLEVPAHTLEGSMGDPHGALGGTTSRRSFWAARVQCGKQWLRQHLFVHVQRLQEMKQHHVHIWNEEKKEYEVLNHCRSKDKKNECKSHFPRTKWLIAQCVVLCRGLLQQMDMPSSGRKNLIGALHGPMNEANINGTHSAMLATQQCNSDVQLPYRLPLTPQTHSRLCPLGKECLNSYDETAMVKACQLAQDAQAGYACDYQNKRQPCGCNEVRECCIGLSKLGKSVKNEPVAYQGKRYMGRILCHAYQNGIVRSAVESRNLRANARDHDVTFAESFRTCATTTFSGLDYMQMLERTVAAKVVVHFERDLRNPQRSRLTSKNMALIYGYRPMHLASLKYLSPYEFTMHWEPQLLQYPRSLSEDAAGLCQAKLTAAGICKIKAAGSSDLLHGVDYVVKEKGGDDWVPLENVRATASLRNEWILQRRRRPRAPQFKGCPLPKHKPDSGEQNSKITMLYFHPWTLREEAWSDEHVPTLHNLKQGSETWQAALRHWLDGNIMCEESKRYVSNFISIHRLRPGDEGGDGLANPDDMMEDEEVFVTKEMLDDVLETRIGGKTKICEDPEVIGDGHHMNSSEAVGLGRDVWSGLGEAEGEKTQPIFAFDEDNVKKSLKSATSSRNMENKFAARSGVETRDEREAALSQRRQATKEDVSEWLAVLETRKREDGRAFVNAKQLEAVAKVAGRVMEELPNRAGCAPIASEPLRWVVHGGPGTGKTHVVRDVIKNELFNQVLQWQQGLDYQVISLQAVMADLLKGDTIHHACGIPVRKKGPDGDVVIQSQKTVAEKTLYWRWLVIDECFMVGASLLAEV